MTDQQRKVFSEEDYQSLYQLAINDNDGYWRGEANNLDWSTPFKTVSDVSYAKEDLHIRWFEEGKLNVCVNCVDRHMANNADKTAIIWEGDEPSVSKRISYRELHEEVCRLANGLNSLGAKAGDRVILYMPMIPEAAYAMLACARLGLTHSIVFGGFSANALADRIENCSASFLITADEGVRGTKKIPLKACVNEALAKLGNHSVKNVICVDATGAEIAASNTQDVDYRELVSSQPATHDAEAFDAEHPLFILYTSGSTGKPKGLQHSSGGYLTYAASTWRHLFNYVTDEVFWCAADVGWITGHTYIIYGPLANGATTLMFEGVPTYPDVGRFGQVIDKHNVEIFYCAPTAIRALLAQASVALAGSERKSLKILGSVGEPINPEVWQWYHDEFGLGQCKIVDTWWQTETGGCLISPLPYRESFKPGAAMTPMFGIQPELKSAEGETIEGAGEGHLVITASWPGQARTIWGDHERFYDTYFSQVPGCYFTGDGAKRDEDNHYWITGRVDDVLNVSGHRLGTAEIESAIVSHESVAEAAVVGYPHEIKGEAIYVYVIPVEGVSPSDELTKTVRAHVREELGPVASPDLIQWTNGLPKTRSGKIMRRILRKIAANDFGELGDTSTLAEPAVVDELIDNRVNR